MTMPKAKLCPQCGRIMSFSTLSKGYRCRCGHQQGLDREETIPPETALVATCEWHLRQADRARERLAEYVDGLFGEPRTPAEAQEYDQGARRDCRVDCNRLARILRRSTTPRDDLECVLRGNLLDGIGMVVKVNPLVVEQVRRLLEREDQQS